MIRRGLSLCALVGIVSGLGWSPAAESGTQWVRGRSANFEILTTAGERAARQSIRDFEQIRAFFVDVLGIRMDLPSRARLVLFRSEQEFLPYRRREHGRAYYIGADDADYIVISRPGGDIYAVAMHEYFHLVVKRSGLKLPVWLNEGLAEVYSTLKPMGGEVTVGDIIPGRRELLRTRKLLDLATLTTVGHDSPHYREKELAALFYSQSWALAHMLQLGTEYKLKLTDFIRALDSGADHAVAFEQAYGKSMARVQRDLEAYIRGEYFFKAVFKARLERSAEDLTVQEADPLEKDLLLANLLVLADKGAEAQTAYASLARDYPGRWEVEEAQAYLALRQNSSERARLHCCRAAELGSTNPKLYYDCARLLRTDEQRHSRAIPMLRKAVELKPDFVDARYQLGVFLMEQQDHDEALRQLGQIRNVSSERAGDLFLALAYVNHQLGRLAEAQVAARRAREYAKTPAEVAWAEDLLRRVSLAHEPQPDPAPAAVEAPEPCKTETTPRLVRKTIEAPAPGPAFPEPKPNTIQGTLEHVDCLGPVARLRVLAGGKRLSFAILDPGKVVIRGADQGALEFQCGQQKPRAISLDYHPQEDTKLGTNGVIVAIEFR